MGNNLQKLGFIAIGAILGITISIVLRTQLQPTHDRKYLGIGFDPIYPIHIYLNEASTSDKFKEIIVTPDTRQMTGLSSWISGLNAASTIHDHTMAPSFDLIAWKARPLPQSVVIMQHIEDRSIVLLIEGIGITKYINEDCVARGTIVNLTRCPALELPMLDCQ